jgi:hypothetical protein
MCIFIQEKINSEIDKSVKASLPVLADSGKLVLSIGNFVTGEFAGLRKSADSAMYIASVLLDSKEFQDVLLKSNFTCKNYGRYCKDQCADCDGRFNGQVVMDSIHRQDKVAVDLFLNNCRGEFGRAARNIFKIQSCYKVVRNDAGWLPFSYCYAYHIAHEYMHIIGFFHTDHKDDVAEKVGLIGYEILNRWYKEGFNPMEVKL